MAITVTVVGAQDRLLEERIRAAGMRPSSMSAAELPTLAHPLSNPPDVVVLDLRAQSQIPPALALVKRQHPDTGLIVVTGSLDPALMLEAMRSGVTECITDIERGDLESAINRLVVQRSQPVSGEVFAFVGAKGGVGTTTVAVNVATAFAKLGSTLLIDMHVSGGDAALFLGADSHFTVIDALDNTHRLDASYFRGLVARSKAGPDLLGSADRAGAAQIDPPRIRTLIEFCSHHYRYTVLDVPRSDAAVLDSLEAANLITVVANQELATVRNAGKVASMLRQRYGKDKVSVVVTRSDRHAEIGLEDVENAVGGQIAHVLPSDYRLAVRALNNGQPLIGEGKSSLAVALQAYARELSGLHQKDKDREKELTGAKSSGFLGRLTGRRG